MGGCFVAAAGYIEKSDGLIVQATERIQTFGREIDFAFNRGSGGEKDFLGGDKGS